MPFDNQQDVGSDEDDVVEDAARSCFKLWHDANDLMLEHQDQHELMMQAKAAKGGNRRERNDISLMDGLDDEEEHDLDYNYEDDQLGSCDEEDLDDDFEEEDLHHLMELDDNLRTIRTVIWITMMMQMKVWQRLKVVPGVKKLTMKYSYHIYQNNKTTLTKVMAQQYKSVH